jgi:O-antigen biosynthesis protein
MARLLPEIIVSSTGEINGLLPAHAEGAPPPALLLDGGFQGLVALQPRKRQARFRFLLPDHLLARHLDLVDPASGRSLLTRPFDLADHYGFMPGLLEVGRAGIAGGFTVRPSLAPFIAVELRHGSLLVARGFAQRNPEEQGEQGGHAYRFLASWLALLPYGAAWDLDLSVGGLVVAEACVRVTAQAIGFTGHLDQVTGGEAVGWAVDFDNPKRRLPIDILVDGEVVRTVQAHLFRQDLAGAGIGDGYCSFCSPLPPLEPAENGRQPTIEAVISGTAIQLAGSPRRPPPVSTILGNFDGVRGTAAHGWALDRLDPGRKLVVEAIGPDGSVLGAAEAKLFRGDLLDADLAGGHCAFRIDLSPHFPALIGHPLALRVAGTHYVLPGSPAVVAPNPSIVRFLRRREAVAPEVLPRLKRRLSYAAGKRGLSIIMPVYNTPRQWLIEALDSLLGQWCDHWELICVDDGSTAPHVREVLRVYAQHDRRIRVVPSVENLGIARATNFGLRAARFDYVAFMDHDDVLEPDAVWQILRAARETDADMLYSDEVLTGESLNEVLDVRCRPAFSYDYYLSHPYFVHMLALRTAIAQRIGGWDESMRISADVDFVLRAIEASRSVAHIPAVLYRWRTHGGSTGHSRQDEVMAATRDAIQRHLDRTGRHATVRNGASFNQFHIDWQPDDGLILIVIPTKNRVDLLRTCVESVDRFSKGINYRIVVIDHESDDPATRAYLDEISGRHVVMPYSGPFNYARMNNQAVAQYGQDAAYVLFLNNDIEVLQEGCIDRLRSLAHREDVGIVGALLLYGDKRVQHAGVIIGFNGSADHAFKLARAYTDEAGTREIGYNASLTAVRDFSAVTAACMMMRRSVFEAVGGYDEELAVGFNDTDLCLRVRELGLKVLYDGATVLFHYESATRGETRQILHPEDTELMRTRWKAMIEGGDPFYNPNLAVAAQDHVLREDGKCRIIHAPRVMPGLAAE